MTLRKALEVVKVVAAVCFVFYGTLAIISVTWYPEREQKFYHPPFG